MKRILMWTIGYLTIVSLLVLVPLSHGQTPSGSRDVSHQLTVRLSLQKKTFFVGETIPLGVRIFNSGDEPLLIGNSISMDSGGVSVARVKFELRDERGRVSPASELAAGVPIQREDKSPVTILLRSYMLLYPGDTLVCRLPLDAFRFEFLGKPGNYALSGVYSSGGLSYLRAYAGAGLTIEEVKSVPFASWSGTIETNKVSFKIVPAARLGKRTNK